MNKTDSLTTLHLKYNVFVEFEIELLTGLYIGGTNASIQIGGVDNSVIRNPFTDEPYIPGSSLRGKMRSLLEKALNLNINYPIGQIKIHSAKTKEDYERSPVCQLFGVTGENPWSRPSRLLVRDIRLSEQSKERMQGQKLDLPFTEIKTEAAIDRITSAATPRKLERVPAGAIFGPGQIVFNIYEDDPYDYLFSILCNGLLLVEDSYLGGQGSRGSGQVRFRNITVSCRSTDGLTEGISYAERKYLWDRPADTLAEFDFSIPLSQLLGAG